jgi:hypothetical protein
LIRLYTVNTQNISSIHQNKYFKVPRDFSSYILAKGERGHQKKEKNLCAQKSIEKIDEHDPSPKIKARRESHARST